MTPDMRALLIAAHKYAVGKSLPNLARLGEVATRFAGACLTGHAVSRPGWWWKVSPKLRPIADWIDAENLSLSEAGRRVGVPTKAISRYLQGQSSVREAERVRSAFVGVVR